MITTRSGRPGPTKLLAVPLSVFATAVAVLLGPTVAHAASGGDANAGDVWVDNVNQPPGPGHEMDPHLDCADINLWGNGLADAGGDYTIDSWSPSGQMEQVYGHAWAYDSVAGGDQVTDVIPVSALIANAVANGDAPVNKQGFHFKLQFVQDPQKHKTFWVNCNIVPGQPSVDFSHACGFERVTVINSTAVDLDVVITQNGSVIDSFTVPALSSEFNKYAAAVGDVFTVTGNGTLLGTNTFKTPVRCLA